MESLRDRRHLETKQALVDAAFELLRSEGFETMTMEEIAEKAGISRSTAYRRFTSKEDIVLEVPRQWHTAWDVTQESFDAEVELFTALAEGTQAVARTIDKDHELVLLAYRALSESTTLQSSGASSTEWIGRVSTTILFHEPSLDQFEAHVLAGAWMGAIDAMMMSWVESGGKDAVVSLTDRLVTQLAGLL